MPIRHRQGYIFPLLLGQLEVDKETFSYFLEQLDLLTRRHFSSSFETIRLRQVDFFSSFATIKRRQVDFFFLFLGQSDKDKKTFVFFFWDN